MNIVFSWILKHTRTDSGGIDSENRCILEYNEATSFFIAVYMMDTLEYRGVYDPELSKLVHHLDVIENIL